jgi:hypothetical protein
MNTITIDRRKWLELVCARTGAIGLVKSLSHSEWKEYQDAYQWSRRWNDTSRVTVVKMGDERPEI